LVYREGEDRKRRGAHMTKSRYIVTDPMVCGGKPVFKGTRIPVSSVLYSLGAGETPDRILKGYPSLTKKHIKEALNFAADMVDYEEREIA
jgi:uncharacterized protein (DUF433 family)